MNGILHQLGLKYGTDKATFHNYCDFYERHLPERIGRLVEIGIMDGASLQMWADYYPMAEIIGVDVVASRCRYYGPRIVTYPWDATDPDQLPAHLADGSVDVIVDDGSHMTADQQRSFELLWPKVRPGGVYIIEDLHTSFSKSYVNTPLSTVEWLSREDWDGSLADCEVRFWSKGPANLVESMTAVIKKPEET